MLFKELKPRDKFIFTDCSDERALLQKLHPGIIFDRVTDKEQNFIFFIDGEPHRTSEDAEVIKIIM